MPRTNRSVAAAAITALTVLTAVKPVRGQDSLTLIQPSSTLIASGSLGGAPFTGQPGGGNSLSTTYFGAVGVSALNLNASTLTIDTPSTSWTAANSGNWMPQANGAAGSAPANYGAQVTVTVILTQTTLLAAIRNAVLTISGSPTVALTQTAPGAYTFPANQTLSFLSGGLDYRDTAGLVTPGHNDLTNQTAANSPATLATLQNTGGNNYTLTYPVDITVNFTAGVAATVRIQGMIVAQGTLTPVPEPSLALAFCLSAYGAVAVWHRARATRHVRSVQSDCAD